jgi:hypothetical protein
VAKKTAGLCGLDLLLDPDAFDKAIDAGPTGPSVVVLVGDDPFVNRHLLLRLRDRFCPDEEDRAWAWREFAGDEQPDPRDVLDEAATVPMFATATRVAVVRRADSFVTACRSLLETLADRPRGTRGLVILEVRSFPATTRLAKAVARHGLAIESGVPPRFNLTRWLQSWKVCDQKSEHLAFTTRGKNLYVIKLAKPTAPFTIEATAGWGADKVKSVKLLGCTADIAWQMTPAGLQITPPAQLGTSNYAWSFEIVTDQEQHTPNVIVTDADAALKNTGKVDLEGNARKTKRNKNK